MADINRSTTITLPADVSNEIMQKTQDESAIMSLATKIDLPGRGATIPVIIGDGEAAWVGETAKKPVSNPEIGTKIMRPYKLAVIETFSEEFTRDAKALYDALIARMPRVLGKKLDNTVIGGTAKPGSDFDNFAACTAQALTATTAYGALVAADTDISAHGGVVNGFALSPQARGILLASTDQNGRPLFVNSVADGAIPMILGARTKINRGMYAAGSPNKAGVVGDWSKALYGTVNDVRIKISDQATLQVGEETINLFQQNMVAVLAEIEIGFRADTSAFNLLTIA